MQGPLQHGRLEYNNKMNVVKSALWRVGFAMRESGQALERLGCRMQGIHSHEEMRKLVMQVNRVHHAVRVGRV